MEDEYWSPIAREYHPVRVGSIDGTDVIAHDRGIIRALNSKYRPNKGVVGDPLCTLFVGRLNFVTTESAISEIFSSFGPVRRVRLVRDIVTGFSKGYAFVEYYDEHTARRACRESAGATLDDKQILVEFECERTLPGWVPRRLGGGFGGRKEAGQLRFGGRDRPFRKPICMLPSVTRSNVGHRQQPNEHTPTPNRFTENRTKPQDSDKESYGSRASRHSTGRQKSRASSER
jgi:U11/U12 small nuclear ribonucleoprotein SNRNP35